AEETRAHPVGQLIEPASRAEGRAIFPAEDPEAAPGTELEHAVPEAVLAHAEEHERAVHEPAEEVRDRRRLRGDRTGAAAADPLERPGDGLRARDHRREVVRHEPHVGERGPNDLLQPGEERGIRRVRYGDVREGLAWRATLGRGEEHEPP